MLSGFMMVRYRFTTHFAVTARYEYFSDPEGFLSGVYHFNGKEHGLNMNGLTAGVEYKPVKTGYIRLEYRYLAANPGNMVFHGNKSDVLQALTLTIGVRF